LREFGEKQEEEEEEEEEKGSTRDEVREREGIGRRECMSIATPDETSDAITSHQLLQTIFP
jgi:hypothetical protein